MIASLRAALTRARSVPLTLWLEVAVLTAAMAFMVRTLDPVFSTVGHQNTLMAATIAAGALAIVLWVFGVPSVFALTASLGAYVAFAAYSIHPDSLTAGLPLVGSVGDVWGGATGGWSDLLSTPAPSQPTDPLLAAPLLMMWWGGFLVVHFATRARPSTFAVLPLAATWIALLILGPGRNASLSTTIVVVGAAMVFLGLDSISVGTGSTQLSDGDVPTVARDGKRRVYRNALSQALPLIVVLVFLSVLVANRTSIVDDEARTDLREQFVPEVTARETVSPLARVRAQLSAASTTDDGGAEVFRFVTTGGALPESGILYLRSTALDNFDDGALWRAGGDYALIGSILTPRESGPGQTFTISVDLTNSETRLGQNRWLGPYLPSPGEAESISGITAAYNSTTGTLIRASDDGGLDGYSVTGTLPIPLDDPSLESSFVGFGDELTSLSSVPELSDDVEATLILFRDEAGLDPNDGPVAKLLKLRDAMQSESFGRDITRAHGHSLAAINRYLGTGDIADARSGVSEQSASAMALLARREGFPARVAVGYRVELDDEISIGDDGQTVVRTSNARAWAEVFLNQFGWIAVDPIVEQTSTLPPPEPPAPVEDPSIQDDALDEAEEGIFIPIQTAPESDSFRWWPFALAAGLIIMTAIPLAKLIRKRRRSAVSEPRPAIIAAWDEARDALVDRGLVVKASATEADVAFSAGSLALTHEHEALSELAMLSATARWADTDPQPNEVEQAWERTSEIAADLRSSSSLIQRVRSIFSWRSLSGDFGRSRGRHTPGPKPDTFDALLMGNEQQSIAFDEFIKSLEADRSHLFMPAPSGATRMPGFSEDGQDDHNPYQHSHDQT